MSREVGKAGLWRSGKTYLKDGNQSAGMQVRFVSVLRPVCVPHMACSPEALWDVQLLANWKVYLERSIFLAV